LCGCVDGFFIVVPILLEVLDRLRSISTRLRSMDRPSVFRAARVDRLAMLDANRARANLFRYSASASCVSTKSNRFVARSSKKSALRGARASIDKKSRRDIAVAAADEDDVVARYRR
jgi:hypothetical protein